MATRPSEKNSKPGRTQMTTVNGGWVSRDAKTGRFVEVGTKSGTFKSRAGSVLSVEAASSRRSAALKRLADR